jgi:hypothetical protein
MNGQHSLALALAAGATPLLAPTCPRRTRPNVLQQWRHAQPSPAPPHARVASVLDLTDDTCDGTRNRHQFCQLPCPLAPPAAVPTGSTTCACPPAPEVACVHPPSAAVSTRSASSRVHRSATCACPPAPPAAVTTGSASCPPPLPPPPPPPPPHHHPALRSVAEAMPVLTPAAVKRWCDLLERRAMRDAWAAMRRVTHGGPHSDRAAGSGPSTHAARGGRGGVASRPRSAAATAPMPAALSSSSTAAPSAEQWRRAFSQLAALQARVHGELVLMVEAQVSCGGGAGGGGCGWRCNRRQLHTSATPGGKHSAHTGVGF